MPGGLPAFDLSRYFSPVPSVPALGIYSPLRPEQRNKRLYLHWGNKKPTDNADSGPILTKVIQKGTLQAQLNCDGFCEAFRFFRISLRTVYLSDPNDINSEQTSHSATDLLSQRDRNRRTISFRAGNAFQISVINHESVINPEVYSGTTEYRAVISFFIDNILLDNLFIEVMPSANQANNPVSYFDVSRFSHLLTNVPSAPSIAIDTGNLLPAKTGGLDNRVSKEIQKLNLSGIVELYQLILPGSLSAKTDDNKMFILYLTSTISEEKETNPYLKFGGKNYIPWPIETDNFNWDGRSAFARPKIRIGLVNPTIRSLFIGRDNELLGAKLRIIKTSKIFLTMENTEIKKIPLTILMRLITWNGNQV